MLTPVQAENSRSDQPRANRSFLIGPLKPSCRIATVVYGHANYVATALPDACRFTARCLQP